MEMLFSVSDQRSPAPAASRGGPTATSEGPNLKREQIFFEHTGCVNGGHVQQGAQNKNDRFRAPASANFCFQFRCGRLRTHKKSKFFLGRVGREAIQVAKFGNHPP